ncbi:hypothetical protein ACH35V_15935 [Actinomadura sp. 1N219]|uniref:hypothetical protein n=1 Tax=Actinomadura sp. 1N219 TaxID=3375152 RepID=UPI0037923418
MGHDDRFRGQDPDNEFARDDESSSMQQDQGGRPPVQDDGYLYGQDESPTHMGGAMRFRLPDEDGVARQEDEFGTYEDAPPDDETEGSW